MTRLFDKTTRYSIKIDFKVIPSGLLEKSLGRRNTTETVPSPLTANKMRLQSFEK